MMDRADYLRLMQFPPEWEAWKLLDEGFLEAQAMLYEPGNESGSEHDRHGLFQWWLRKTPEAEILTKLAHLSWLDPDPVMAGYVRECISEQPHCDAQVSEALTNTYSRTRPSFE